MVLMLDDSGNVTDRVLYGPAVDQVFAEEGSSGDVTWTLGDNQNTIRDLAQYNATTGATAIVNHRVFSAFGQLLSETDPTTGQPATVSSSFGYTGCYFDAATGLQWNVNRWYNPSIQRWMGQDPIASTTNLYCYCGNDPAIYVDPGGLADAPQGPYANNTSNSTNLAGNAGLVHQEESGQNPYQGGNVCIQAGAVSGNAGLSGVGASVAMVHGDAAGHLGSANNNVGVGVGVTGFGANADLGVKNGSLTVQAGASIVDTSHFGFVTLFGYQIGYEIRVRVGLKAGASVGKKTGCDVGPIGGSITLGKR